MKHFLQILSLLVISIITAIPQTTTGHEPDASIANLTTTAAKVYFIEPEDGQTVKKKFRVKFGLSSFGVAPAGTHHENTGHHHLLIDTDDLPDLTMALPATDKIKHFGGGQTEAMLELPPGKHTLQLLLGNYAHVAHKKPVISKKITIIVK